MSVPQDGRRKLSRRLPQGRAGAPAPAWPAVPDHGGGVGGYTRARRLICAAITMSFSERPPMSCVHRTRSTGFQWIWTSGWCSSIFRTFCHFVHTLHRRLEVLELELARNSGRSPGEPPFRHCRSRLNGLCRGQRSFSSGGDPLLLGQVHGVSFLTREADLKHLSAILFFTPRGRSVDVISEATPIRGW